MSAAWVIAVGQALLIAAFAPLLVGLMRAVRARMEGRAGGRIAQPWRDLRKLLRKEPISPSDAGMIFAAAPVVLLASSLTIAAVVPSVATSSPLPEGADFIAVVGLLLLGSVVLALAGLDTGTAFGGMGASREMVIAALVEPTLLVAIFAVTTRVSSTDLSSIVAAGATDPGLLLAPASVLAALALALAVLAESGRLPVDNPTTHLELTMVHEAMVLEYSGRDLALMEWAAAIRLTILLNLLLALFAPWGIATAVTPTAVTIGVVALLAKLAISGSVLAAGEVFVAKLRLFRIPELLAGSFALAVLAVITSFVMS